jgi:GNAT superfamily N-acetyltransferase
LLRDEAFLAALLIEPCPPGFRATGFDCGEQDLTDYICDGTSANDELAGVSRSYLVLLNDKLVGYFTVSADSIRLDTKERPAKVRYPNAPAIKLGRMGVHLSYWGRGAGEWILDNVVGLAQLLSEQVGIRYVTLDALQRPKLISLYQSYGFVRNKEESKTQRLIRKLKSGQELPHVSMRYDIKL